MSLPSLKTRWTRWADRFGATASFLCALHCAVLPLLVAILPMLGLEFLADHRFEQGFVIFAVALALTTLLIGFRRHRRRAALLLLLPGVGLLLVGMLITFDHDTQWHAVFVSLGGTLLACAHWVNLRLSHPHAHDALCSH